MTLFDLEQWLKKARADGAVDETDVFLMSEKWEYMRDVAAVEFQKRESWKKEEWPLVILDSKPNSRRSWATFATGG